MKSRIAIIGLGNILLQDEGIGIHVVQYLQQSYSFHPKIELIDGGTAGLELIPYFEENDKIIIVDAVDFGKEPGFIGSFKNDEILHLFKEKISLHHLGLSDLLGDLKLHNIYPQQIYLFGMQPAHMDIGLELSEIIQPKIEQFCKILKQQLLNWNISFKKVKKSDIKPLFMKT